MSTKSKLVIYGNCQAWAVYWVLAGVPAVTERWEVVFFDPWPDDERRRREAAEIAEAKVLLLQNIRNWTTHPMHNRLSGDTRVLRFPFCYFAPLWPFDSFIAGPDKAMFNAMFAAKEKGEMFSFECHDALMGRLRSQIADPEERVARYSKLDFDDAPDIQRYAEFEKARLLAEDERLGYTIGRFIVDNYRDIRLFHGLAHPVGSLIDRLVKEVLNKLEIDPQSAGQFDDRSMRDTQVPIHPVVIEKLGLRWVTPESLYNNKALNRMVSFHEYYLNYARYLDGTASAG
jgi:hypothetical protein